jgi:hypothetical protein
MSFLALVLANENFRIIPIKYLTAEMAKAIGAKQAFVSKYDTGLSDNHSNIFEVAIWVAVVRPESSGSVHGAVCLRQQSVKQ